MPRPPRKSGETGDRRFSGGRPGREIPRAPAARSRPSKLRVIAGALRHRQFLYDGDPSVRPMRDAVREALFNILGETVVDAVLWDAFAGTGAVGIEGLSRGGHHAVFCERSRSVAAVLKQNLAALAIDPRATVIVGDTFLTLPPRMDAQRMAEPLRPWILFLCPPYAMFDEHPDPLRDLLGHARASAPPHSWLAIECDDRQAAETQLAPDLPWDARQYGNTRLLIAPLQAEGRSQSEQPPASSEAAAEMHPGEG